MIDQIQRTARNEPGTMDCRTVTIAGRTAVYVTSRRPGRKNDVVYTVTQGRRTPRCNCPHYQHRLAGTLGRCRHIEAVQAFLGNGEERGLLPAVKPVSAETPEECARRFRADWPED